MCAQVIILHGYSDNSDSFKPLAAFLRAHGFDVTPLYLGNYVSLEDSLTIPDLAKAFSTALAANQLDPSADQRIDLIVHSTGSLVAREWMTRYFLEQGKGCPVDHYLMLAPANFGSPLGHVGKTMFGRVVKGWNTDFESGRRILNALELGSPYSWSLAERDLFGARSFYRPEDCKAAILVGSKPYQKGLRKLVDKNGGDGTVYVATANLNAALLDLHFGEDPAGTRVNERAPAYAPMAFGVFPDRDHGSITDPASGSGSLGEYILAFLKVRTPQQYQDYGDACARLTRQTLPPQPTDDIFHTYQHLVSRVSDDLGNPVDDYFLEFYEKDSAQPTAAQEADELMAKIHTEILESVHVCETDKSYRSLLFDLTDLSKELDQGKEIMFSLSAAPLSGHVSYSAGSAQNASELPLYRQAGTSFIYPNQTFLADIRIDRLQTKETFTLKGV
jgi:pimeloyl-ACP methyl ester carboxylesterase